MKELGLKIYDAYTYVFDHNINPLKNIKEPTDRAYVMAVLFVMWWELRIRMNCSGTLILTFFHQR